MSKKSPARVKSLLLNCITASTFLLAPSICLADEISSPPDADYVKIDEIERRADKEFRERKINESLETRKTAVALLLAAPVKIPTAYRCQQLATELDRGWRVNKEQIISLNKYALEIYDQILEPNSPQSVPLLMRLTELTNTKSTRKEMEKYCIRALRAAEIDYGMSDIKVAKICDELARYYRAEKNWTEVEKLLKRSSHIYDASIEAGALRSATSCDELAEAYFEQGKLAEAENLYQESITSYSKSLGPNSILVASLLDRLSDVFVKAGKLTDAENALKRSVAIKTTDGGPSNAYLIATLDRYAQLMEVKKDPTNAARYRSMVQAIREKYPESEPTSIMDMVGNHREQ